MTPCTNGFWILGPVSEPRRLVDAAAALAAYASCDERAEVEREAYLSAFQFADDMRHYIDCRGAGSTAGYNGPCWSAWLWFDIDRDRNLPAALADARRLALSLDERYRLPDDSLLIFYSGSKGFHVGLPTVLWLPESSALFHKAARRFAEAAAEAAGVAIDTGVYDAVRAFRAPNSRHRKTGLHKRRLSLDELTGYTVERIVELARQPAPFDLPEPRGASEQAAADWQAAVERVARDSEAKAARRAATDGAPTLNRATLEFIRNAAGQGDRHRLLFSAAANLGEFGCPPALAHALLSEAGLDSGLSPKDVRRQIDCGLAAVGPAAVAGPIASAVEPADAVLPLPPSSEPTADPALAEKLRALWAGATAAAQSESVPPSQPASTPGLPAEPNQRPPAGGPPRCVSHTDPADWLDEPAADRPGWLRMCCRRCGAIVGSRPAGERGTAA